MAGGGHVSTYSDVCLDPLLTPVSLRGGHVSTTAVLTVMCVLIHYSHLYHPAAAMFPLVMLSPH